MKNKWVIQWVGLIALGILIWWGGPMINVAGRVPLDLPANRLLLLLLVIIVWLTYHLVTQTRSTQTDLNLMAELSVVEQDPAQAFITEAKNEEAIELKNKFQTALKVLKETQTREKLNQRYLYELPWYVIIGAPGSGKTTLLTNSGIHFPVKDKLGAATVQGIGGTRNCNWLFSNEAIFIDTAGRYTTQDSHKAIDAAAWERFLKLLKKYRPQRPVNGVLFTLSLSDILTWSEEELSRYARTLRRRAMELYEQLGVTIPIYLLLTKCDLIAGFNEFFEDLDVDKRGQVWGFTLPIDPRSPLKTSPTYLEKLLARLEKRKIRRVQQERDLVRRGLILDFPQQMELLQPLLIRFINEAFHSSRYEQRTLFRGVYFTSGTQQGTPIDRIMSRLAGAFGLDAQKHPVFSGHVKSFFITRLLSEVVFPESELAGVDRGVMRRRNLRRWGLNGALLGVMSIFLILWATSYTHNKVALNQVDKLIDSYETLQVETAQYGSDPKHLLERLNTISAAEKIFEKRPWWEGFGLYQGRKMQWGIQRIYQKLLLYDGMELIRSRIESDLEQSVKMGAATDPSKLYELLRVYLMLGMPEKMKPAVLHQWVRMDNADLFGGDSDRQAQLQVHLEKLLRLPLDALPLNRDLIARARNVLAGYPLHQIIYANLKSRLLQANARDLYLKDVLGPNGVSILTTVNGQSPADLHIPAWYTVEGYRVIFENNGPGLINDALKQNWVMPLLREDQEIRSDRVYAQLQQDYFKDYERHWRNLLRNLRVKSIANADQAIHISDSLAGPESPLKLLLLALHKNTTSIQSLNPSKADTAPSGGRWYGPANAQAAYTDPTSSLSPAGKLADHFSALTDLVQQQSNQSSSLDRVLSQLAQLRDAMLSNNSEDTADVIRRSKREFSRLPAPIDSWLLPLTEFEIN